MIAAIEDKFDITHDIYSTDDTMLCCWDDLEIIAENLPMNKKECCIPIITCGMSTTTLINNKDVCTLSDLQDEEFLLLFHEVNYKIPPSFLLLVASQLYQKLKCYDVNFLLIDNLNPRSIYEHLNCRIQSYWLCLTKCNKEHLFCTMIPKVACVLW